MPRGISLACCASAAASAARSAALAHPGTRLADLALAIARLDDRIARLFPVRTPASLAPPFRAAPAVPASAAAEPRPARPPRPISSAPLGLLTPKPPTLASPAPILSAGAPPAPVVAKPRATDRRHSINSMPLGARRPIHSTAPSATATAAVAARPAATISSVALVARLPPCSAAPRRPRGRHATLSAAHARAAAHNPRYPPATAVGVAIFHPMLPSPAAAAAPCGTLSYPAPIYTSAYSMLTYSLLKLPRHCHAL